MSIYSMVVSKLSLILNIMLLSDIQYLSVLFFFQPIKKWVIHDPLNTIEKNITLQNEVSEYNDTNPIVEEPNETVFICMNELPENVFQNLGSFKGVMVLSRSKVFTLPESKKFFYINNEFKGIKWVFNSNMKTPDFLNIYTREKGSSKLINQITSLVTRGNWQSAIAHGKLEVLGRNLRHESKLSVVKYEDMGVFLGRSALTGKLIVSLSSHHATTHFVKIPVKKNGLDSVKNELLAYQKLKEVLQSEIMQIPEFHVAKDWLITSNLMSKSRKPATIIDSILINSLFELYQSLNKKIPLGATVPYVKSVRNIQQINKQFKEKNLPSGISAMSVTHLLSTIISILKTLETHQEIQCSWYHGDFTPWNILTGNNSCGVFDWEKAAIDIPAMFDLYYFIFFKTTYEAKPDISAFKKELKNLRKQKEFKAMQAHFNIDEQVHFNLFVCWYISDKLKNLITHRVIPYQANWIVYFWREVLETVR